jgi:hypothetical protein
MESLSRGSSGIFLRHVGLREGFVGKLFISRIVMLSEAPLAEKRLLVTGASPWY